MNSIDAVRACPAIPVEEAALLHGSLTDPALRAHPNAFYAALRHNRPVYYDEKLGSWLVSRFEDLQAVVRDPATFSVEQGYKAQYAKGFFDEFKAILEKEGGGFFPDAIMTDPPAHTRIRRLLDAALTAHRVKSLEPGITRIAINLVEKVADKGKCDGVLDIAVPFTIAVICEQLGISQYDADKIQRWSLAVTAQIGRLQDHDQMLANARDICDLQHYLIARMKERQAEPREDMISDIVHARTEDPEHPEVTFGEAVSLLRALLIAGNETTATAMGNLLYLLATRPDLADDMAANIEDDRILNRFVEELLRYEPPVRALSRMTTREVELNGVTLPAGAHMLLLFASANDDETKFPCPRSFDLTRTNVGQHVAFSAGVHRCAGAALARMEIKVAAREILRRLKDIRLAIPMDEVRYLPTIATRSIESLPLTFVRRA